MLVNRVVQLRDVLEGRLPGQRRGGQRDDHQAEGYRADERLSTQHHCSRRNRRQSRLGRRRLRRAAAGTELFCSLLTSSHSDTQAVVKVDRRIRWHYTTTILRIGAGLTRYRNFARTISRHADGISRYSVPPSAGPLLPLPSGCTTAVVVAILKIVTNLLSDHPYVIVIRCLLTLILLGLHIVLFSCTPAG